MSLVTAKGNEVILFKLHLHTCIQILCLKFKLIKTTMDWEECELSEQNHDITWEMNIAC